MILKRLLRIGLNVADLDRSEHFYREALGFTLIERTGEHLLLGFGAGRIALTSSRGAPTPADGTAADLWFQHFAIRVTDIAAAWDRVARVGSAHISIDGPVTLPAAAGGVTAQKFRDPDGHPLELIAGLPGADRIDHTAISVADAARSIEFYAAHGLRLTARQRNHGPEQDRLDGLAGVSVDVVALAPPVPTPHVELLAYATPRGRPAGQQPGDIAATRMVFAADVAGPTLLRDPDGHLIEALPDA